MSKRRWRKFLLSIVAAALLLIVSVYAYWPDDQLHLITCDVGQGDAVLIAYGFQQVLIDAGPSEQGVLECLGTYLPWWDRTIELMVITHADADHIGGVNKVLERYEVQGLLFNGDYKDTTMFRETVEAVQQEHLGGADVKLPILGLQWRFSLGSGSFFKKEVRNPQQLSLTVLSPRVETTEMEVEKWLKTETFLWDKTRFSQVLGESTDEPNDRSIVLLLEFGKVSALLTGDLEEEGEQSLLATGLIHPVTILKVGHHGANTSSTWDFLKAVAPEISLVSAGHNNRYGHPSPEVIERLNQFDIDIWRTDQQGTIEVVTDGETYRVDAENESLF